MNLRNSWIIIPSYCDLLTFFTFCRSPSTRRGKWRRKTFRFNRSEMRMKSMKNIIPTPFSPSLLTSIFSVSTREKAHRLRSEEPLLKSIIVNPQQNVNITFFSEEIKNQFMFRNRIFELATRTYRKNFTRQMLILTYNFFFFVFFFSIGRRWGRSGGNRWKNKIVIVRIRLTLKEKIKDQLWIKKGKDQVLNKIGKIKDQVCINQRCIYMWIHKFSELTIFSSILDGRLFLGHNNCCFTCTANIDCHLNIIIVVLIYPLFNPPISILKTFPYHVISFPPSLFNHPTLRPSSVQLSLSSMRYPAI